MAPVLSRVTLRRAVDHDDKGVAAILWHRGCEPIATSTPVIRASSLEITRLFVTDELIGTVAADDLADRLATRYDVEAVAGFPEYAADDWDTRPDWMHTEPWRTLCAVDAVMSGFTRDGYQGAA